MVFILAQDYVYFNTIDTGQFIIYLQLIMLIAHHFQKWKMGSLYIPAIKFGRSSWSIDFQLYIYF